MSRPLSKSADPFELARQGSLLEGSPAPADMARLAPSLAADGGEVEARLACNRDAAGQAFVAGHVAARLPLVCQRCLEPVAVDVEADFRLALVESESEIARLGEEYEPLMVEGRSVRPLDIVEDELILALPLAPMHAEPCGTRVREHEGEKASGEAETRKPFADLADLMKSKHS